MYRATLLQLSTPVADTLGVASPLLQQCGVVRATPATQDSSQHQGGQIQLKMRMNTEPTKEMISAETLEELLKQKLRAQLMLEGKEKQKAQAKF